MATKESVRYITILMKIEYKNEKTYINDREISTNWRFISDGTWYDKDSECKL